MQYSLLQCNVVIRENFLFRYSAIPLFLIPHFLTSPINVEIKIHWAKLFAFFMVFKSAVKVSQDYKHLSLITLKIMSTFGQGNVKVFPQKLQWGWNRECLAQQFFPHLWLYSRGIITCNKPYAFMPICSYFNLLHFMFETTH